MIIGWLESQCTPCILLVRQKNIFLMEKKAATEIFLFKLIMNPSKVAPRQLKIIFFYDAANDPKMDLTQLLATYYK